MHGDFCSACGFHGQPTDRFCRGCGEALTAEARAAGPINEAESLVARGELDEALATVQRALGEEERPDLLVAQATLYLRRGDAERAERSLERAAAVDPTYAVAYAYRGALLFQRGKVDEGQALLDKAAALDPKDLVVRMKRAEIWLRLGVLEKAEAELRIGLTNGGWEPLRTRNGRSNVRFARKAEARECYAKLRSAPDGRAIAAAAPTQPGTY